LSYREILVLAAVRLGCNAARRGVFDGERVANSEEPFSIFEPHAQSWCHFSDGH
jgi:hypothetical protein